MTRFRIGMRWWLALAFAVIAAVTAAAVAGLFYARAERALRDRAEDFAVGNTVGAADEIGKAVRKGTLQQTVETLAQRRRLAIFVYDSSANLLTPERSRRINVESIPLRIEALAAALSGERYDRLVDHGRGTLVAVPAPFGRVVLAYASRPELAAQLGIVRRKIVEAALLAIPIGALAGFLVATLLAGRLRRIAAAAAAIEGGSFETRLEPGFRDELGVLAVTIDRMRLRLRESFAKLESERDRLRRLLERLHDGVVAVDRELRVEYANSAARRLLGVDRLDEGDPLPEPWSQLSLAGLAESLFRGSRAPAPAVVTPTAEHTYTVVGIPAGADAETAVLVVTDVSERERRERAEREFVTNAAHELRTPLTTITGAVEVLQAGAKEVPEERDRFLRHIQREAGRLGRLTRALLVLARAQTREETPRAAPVYLRPLLEAIAGDLEPAEEVEIGVECPTELAVLADRDLVEQALANLAANAVQNTEQGRISISVRPLGDRSAVIEVQDTGRGIPREQQERIFDRFYRGHGRDAQGFGLGLAIVREAVKALGGRLELDSSPGVGTTVRLVLPLARAQAA
jgi:signal transduction histidine kinase/HAMP domain-containing protein